MHEKTFHDIEHEAWSGRAGDYDTVFASISTQAIDDILDSLGPLGRRRHLDVACGTGHLVAAASKRGAISEGIDFAQAMVDVARANYPENSFQAADAKELPYGDRSFVGVARWLVRRRPCITLCISWARSTTSVPITRVCAYRSFCLPIDGAGSLARLPLLLVSPIIFGPLKSCSLSACLYHVGRRPDAGGALPILLIRLLLGGLCDHG